MSQTSLKGVCIPCSALIFCVGDIDTWCGYRTRWLCRQYFVDYLIISGSGLQLIAAVFLKFSGVVSDIQNEAFSKQKLNVSVQYWYLAGENTKSRKIRRGDSFHFAPCRGVIISRSLVAYSEPCIQILRTLSRFSLVGYVIYYSLLLQPFIGSEDLLISQIYLCRRVTAVLYATDRINNQSTSIRINPYFQLYNPQSVYHSVISSCELLENNISLVISPDNSDIVGLQADIFNRVNVPLISTSATDPNLKTVPDWLITSHVTLITYSDWLFTCVGRFLLVIYIGAAVVHFFNAVEDIDRLDLADILKNVERNLERVFVLHCEDRYASAVLQKAQKYFMYIWNRRNQEILVPDWVITSHVTWWLCRQSRDLDNEF
eukprot:sb/3465772/